MLLDLCRKNEGNPFSTKIWVVGSYTDTLLRWLKTVSSAYIWMGRYNLSLSLDVTIMVSKHCPIIGEYVGIIFVTL